MNRKLYVVLWREFSRFIIPIFINQALLLLRKLFSRNDLFIYPQKCCSWDSGKAPRSLFCKTIEATYFRPELEGMPSRSSLHQTYNCLFVASSWHACLTWLPLAAFELALVQCLFGFFGQFFHEAETLLRIFLRTIYTDHVGHRYVI